VQETGSVPCAPQFSKLLGRAVGKFARQAIALPSGAGHDAAVMSRIAPVAMLFIRCRGGISHHPDESATIGDIAVALAVMNDFIQQLAQTM
jgi:allantoate deiminase